jgi:hypothetical protein
MATSGITDWPLTAEQFVTQACYELGEYSAGEVPDAEIMEDGILRLNAMLKGWEGEGNLFREATETVTVPAGTGTVAAPNGTRDISSVRHTVSATYSRQLAEWNRGEFYSLPNRAQTTATGPSAFYVSKTISGLTIHVWPVPSADIDLELDYSRIGETVTDPSQTVDVPQEWQECVILGLASRMASMLGTTRIDPATVQRIDAKATTIYQKLLDRDRPNSYIFEPDC